MIYLLLSIVSATTIYICFKTFKRFDIPTFPAIVVNYFAAALLGFWLFAKPFSFAEIKTQSWFLATIVTGVMFISLFNLVAYGTQKSGITVTAIATKMSLVLPVAFFVLTDPAETWHLLKALAIGLAVAGVILSSLNHKSPDTPSTTERNRGWLWTLLLPFSLFIGSGLLDLMLAYSEKNLFDSAETIKIFVPTAFATAAMAGSVWLLFGWRRYKSGLNIKILAGGSILGAANFCSIYFLLKAYRDGFLQYSEVIPLNNVGIVAASTLCGWLVFREKLSPRNFLGLLLCGLAIWLLL